MTHATIFLHSPIKLNDRPMREIHTKEHKLDHRLLDSGVICLRNLEGHVLMHISPSQWSHIENMHSPDKT